MWCIHTMENYSGTSLVAQRIKICLAMQGTWVWSLIWADPTCYRATKPMHHNYWACVLELLKPTCSEPVLCNEEQPPLPHNPCAATKTPTTPQKKGSSEMKRNKLLIHTMILTNLKSYQTKKSVRKNTFCVTVLMGKTNLQWRKSEQWLHLDTRRTNDQGGAYDNFLVWLECLCLDRSIRQMEWNLSKLTEFNT